MTDRAAYAAGSACSVQGCGRPRRARGWCKTHWLRWRTHGDPQAHIPVAGSITTCTIEGCSDAYSAKGYCNKHYKRFRLNGDPHEVALVHGDDPGRFWAMTDKRPDGCWLWVGSLTTEGYGAFSAGGKHVLAHRWAYAHLVGPITEQTLDHLCRVRNCVNPDHLEPVTQRENIRRGTSPAAVNAAKATCISGHAFDEANTYMYRGGRSCRECARTSSREYHRRRRMAAQGGSR